VSEKYLTWKPASFVEAFEISTRKNTEPELQTEYHFLPTHFLLTINAHIMIPSDAT